MFEKRLLEIKKIYNDIISIFQNFYVPVLEGSIKNLIVENCNEVFVPQETFQSVDYIEHIQFNNIKELRLENLSLEFKRRLPTPKIKLIFNNVSHCVQLKILSEPIVFSFYFQVNFTEILPYSISGCVDSISFNNCYIQQLKAYAINCVCQTVYSVSIENSRIDWIESQALKKMTIEHFIMRNTTFSHDLPSRAFNALIIKNEFSITNCVFAGISSRTIDLDGGCKQK